MASVWAEAEVQLHVDGTPLPGETRRAAIAAAQEGGKAFKKSFTAQMRKAAVGAVRDFGVTFRKEMGKVFRSTRVFALLQRSLRTLRRDFRIAGQAAKSGFGLALDNVRKRVRNLMTPLKEMRFEIGNSSAKAVKELREGFQHMKITVEDLEHTFPRLAGAVRNVRGAFNRAKTSASTFGDSLRKLVPVSDQVRESAGTLSTAWDRLRNTFRNIITLSGDVRTAQREVAAALDEQTEAVDETADATAAQTEATKRNTTATDNNQRSHRTHIGILRKSLSAWKRLPHGLRQAVFWTGLVIAALGSASVLTSALAGTIVALSTAFIGLGTGIGIAVAGFAGLFDETTKLNAGAAATKKAFQDLGDAFGALQTGITNRMFDGMAESIQGITDTLLPALEDSILSFAGVVGENLGRVFEALSSPLAIENFQALLAKFEPIFTSLTDAVIGFGSGIGGLLVASLPTAEAFADAIGDVGIRFGEWANSEEGRDRLAQFFDTAERIMPKVVDLVVAFADALAGLVTPVTLSGFEAFVDALTDVMPILGGIVGIVANLNVFGILAAALQVIGGLIGPLIEPLSEFAAVLGTMLVEGLQKLIPSFERLGEALGPIIELIGAIVTAVLPPLIDIIGAVIEFLADWIEIMFQTTDANMEFKDAVVIVGAIVGGIFQVLGAIIKSVLDISIGLLGAMAALLRGDFKGAFKIMYDTVSKILSNFGIDIEDVITFMNDLWKKVDKVLKDIVRAFQNAFREIGNFFRDLGGWIEDAIGWLGSLFGAASSAQGAASNAARAGGSTRPTAAGALLLRPTRILAGEAGPEAIVPLRRALNQVDPAVRGLSAIAQGKRSAASGGVAGMSRIVNFTEGSIVVQEVSNGERTALSVANRVAEKVAS